MERAMDLRPDMAASLGSLVKQEYQIPDSYYFGEVKRGLRNSDGTGVLIGVRPGLSDRRRQARAHARQALLPRH